MEQQPNMHSERTLQHTRIVRFSPEQVFAACAQASLLSEWWGPNGFTNTFHEFTFQPGGPWRFTMHAPDGTSFDNFCRFVEIKPGELVVLDHIEPVHSFRISLQFTKTGIGTQIDFIMTFVLQEEYERVKDFVRVANEQNLDRLEAVLQKTNKAAQEEK